MAKEQYSNTKHIRSKQSCAVLEVRRSQEGTVCKHDVSRTTHAMHLIDWRSCVEMARTFSCGSELTEPTHPRCEKSTPSMTGTRIVLLSKSSRHCTLSYDDDNPHPTTIILTPRERIEQSRLVELRPAPKFHSLSRDKLRTSNEGMFIHGY